MSARLTRPCEMSPSPHEVTTVMNEIASRATGSGTPEFAAPLEQPGGIEQHLATADLHKDAGVHLPGPTRLAGMKEMVLRVARVYTTQQSAFNRAVLATLHELHKGLQVTRADLDQRAKRWQASLTSAVLVQDELRHNLDQVRDDLLELRTKVFDLGRERAADRTELYTQRSRLDFVLRDLRARVGAVEPAEIQGLADLVGDPLVDIYRQLEDRFRGSRDDIFELQKVYLADVLALEPGAPVIDIGCGRGEWLEALKNLDVPAYGVDLNDVFVEANQERGLDVRLGDAVEHLEHLDGSSVGAITGFHLIEHLEFPVFVRLLDAALQALRPGGLVIFETPNPTNLVVGASAFYLDPTHRNPLHPQFVQFLLEARGFVDVEIRFLHPSTEPQFAVPDSLRDEPATFEAMQRLVDHLNWAFFGPQDFAVVARKAGAAPASTA